MKIKRTVIPDYFNDVHVIHSTVYDKDEVMWMWDGSGWLNHWGHKLNHDQMREECVETAKSDNSK